MDDAGVSRPDAILTERLRLEPLDAARAALQVDDPERFFEALSARASPDWPPPLHDEDAAAHTRDALAARPEDAGWESWIFIETGAHGGPDIAIGAGGFHGPPNTDGEVEIGYAIVRSSEGRGLASDAAAGLVEHAFKDARVQKIIAHTQAGNEFDAVASRRVVAKLGFEGPQPTSDPDIVRFVLSRP